MTDEEELVDAFLLASRALVGVAARSLVEAAPDVTLPQFRAMVVLATKGSQRIGDLAAELAVNQSTATRLCDRLERRGLVCRERSAHDGRSVCVQLTPVGVDVIDTVTRARRRDVSDILGTMSAEQLTPLVHALRVFGDAAGEAPEQSWSLGWGSLRDHSSRTAN